MATMLKRKLSTTEAAKLANAALQLDDLHRLAIALAEVAAEHVVRDRAFADRVRTVYEQVPPASNTSRRPDPFAVQLVPIKRVEGRDINPSAPLDPYFLLEVYGPQQLEAALNRYPVAKLKEGAAKVEARNPGTKPKNRGQRAALTEYIVRYVAS